MLKLNKIFALFFVLLFSVLLVAGCAGHPDGNHGMTSVVVQEAPSAPKNAKATVQNGKIVLSWDKSSGATGYVVSLYDPDSKSYTELATVTDPSFTYTPETKQRAEFGFGIYAFVDGGDRKIYSTTLSKVTAKVIKETLELEPSHLKVSAGETETIKAIVDSNDKMVMVHWESDDPSIAKIDGKGVVTGVSEGTTKIRAVTSNGTEAVCDVTVLKKMVVTKGKLLAITFDDGPNTEHTGRLLDALKKHNAKATFFMVGQNVNRGSDLVKRMRAEGHELGNHSWSHANLPKLSKQKMEEEISKTNEAIYAACGAYPTVFRAPYGELNDSVLRALTVPSIYWSIDTEDWKYRDAEYVKKQILKNAYDGGIILLHDIHKTSVDGFIAALDQLEKDGYTLVTVTELLSRNGTIPQAGVTYYDAVPKS